MSVSVCVCESLSVCVCVSVAPQPLRLLAGLASRLARYPARRTGVTAGASQHVPLPHLPSRPGRPSWDRESTQSGATGRSRSRAHCWRGGT